MLPLLFLFTMATLSLANCQATPIPPSFTHLYSMNCTLGPQVSVGGGPKGTRLVIPIVGGWFKGTISGKILDIGADWGLVDPKGVFSPDTRYNLQTDDGANIFIQTNGPSQPDGRSHLRATFETGSEKYWWLNDVVGIGILTAPPAPPGGGPAYVLIEMWQVVSPPVANATATPTR